MNNTIALAVGFRVNAWPEPSEGEGTRNEERGTREREVGTQVVGPPPYVCLM